MSTPVHATIASRVGLHARPVSVFTRAVKATGIPVTIGRPGKDAVNAASPLMVLSLGIVQGDSVVLASEAPDADGHLHELAQLLETELDA